MRRMWHSEELELWKEEETLKEWVEAHERWHLILSFHQIKRLSRFRFCNKTTRRETAQRLIIKPTCEFKIQKPHSNRGVKKKVWSPFHIKSHCNILQRHMSHKPLQCYGWYGFSLVWLLMSHGSDGDATSTWFSALRSVSLEDNF